MDVKKSSTAATSGDATSEVEDKDAYTVGWICALPLEMAAANLMLDKVYDVLIEQDEADHNSYILGLMRGHNVVIACLPDGVYGTNPAAAVAKDMLRTFKSIRFGLLVGVGGGAPSLEHDIRLGDVVVSKPTGTNGGVIQYDRGKAKQHEEFERTGSLNAPPNVLLTAVGRLRARHSLGDSAIPQFLSDAVEKIKKPKIRQKFGYQGELDDCLFRAEYDHVNNDSSCNGCDYTQTIQREDRDDTDPVVHYGNIASGNQVIKNGKTRDRLSKELGVMCFEMEAAGLMQEFPCLVIRGVCDYSDSHKNKRWQEYAATTAAAFAKELLSVVAPSHVKRESLIHLDTQLHALISDTKNAIQHQTQKQEDRHEYSNVQECLRELCQTDPKKDRLRIIGGSDGNQSLFEASYAWILTLPEFRRWQTDPESRRLWIRGGPGKGKTMLLCGIIEKLEKSNMERLCYFFCQATVPALNNATSVLRGLIYQLVQSYPWLLRPVLAVYNDGGKTRFEDHNAWETMSELFVTMLSDPCMDGVLLIVDALDECVTDRLKLLGIIQRISEISRARIIVSSRKWAEIDEILGSNEGNASTIALELHDSLISKAVQSYIERKVAELADRKKLDANTCARVEAYLRRKSHDTFLWVALVCQELFGRGVQGHNVMKVVSTFPPGLDALYTRMMETIPLVDADLFKETLTIVSVLKCPVTPDELCPLLQSSFDGGKESLEQAITSWGSFFNIQEGKIYFVHQSAVEFLQSKASKLPSIADRHYSIFWNSLDVLKNSEYLRRDIYGLEVADIPFEEINRPSPDPLSALQYCCMYWIDHLVDWAGADGRTLTTTTSLKHADAGAVDKIHNFLKGKFLYWVEALALLHRMPHAVQAVQRLQKLVDVSASQDVQVLSEFVGDANRFLLYHREMVQDFPLQLYASALVFVPEQSVVKNCFYHEAPQWVAVKPGVGTTWNACLQTLETHTPGPQTLAYSLDGQWLVSGSQEGILRLWHAESGTCVQRLDAYSEEPHRYSRSHGGKSGREPLAAFTADNQSFVSVSWNGLIKVWDRLSGSCVRELRTSRQDVTVMAISSDGSTVASDLLGKDIGIWSTQNRLPFRRLKCHRNFLDPIALSADGQWLASASRGIIRIWSTLSGRCKQALEDCGSTRMMTWSTDGQWLASGGSFIKIWEWRTGLSVLKIEHRSEDDMHPTFIDSLTFSSDRKLLAANLRTHIYVWNTATGALVWDVETLSGVISAILFSPDTLKLVSALQFGTIKVWDLQNGENVLDQLHAEEYYLYHSDEHHFAVHYPKFQKIMVWGKAIAGKVPVTECHQGNVSAVAFSKDNRKLASVSTEGRITIWDIRSGAYLETFDHADESERSMIKPRLGPFANYAGLVFQDTVRLASAASGTIKIWDTSDCSCIQKLEDVVDHDEPMTFSRDGRLLAYCAEFGTRIKIWNTGAKDRKSITTMRRRGHNHALSLSFSSDSRRLASSSPQGVKLWDVTSGACMGTFEAGSSIRLSFDAQVKRRVHTQFGFVDLPAPPGPQMSYLRRSNPDSDDSNPASSDDSDFASSDEGSENEPFSEYKGNMKSFCGYGMSDDMNWIVLDKRQLLRIPPDYRPIKRSEPYQVTPVMNGAVLIWMANTGSPVRMQFTRQRYPGEEISWREGYETTMPVHGTAYIVQDYHTKCHLIKSFGQIKVWNVQQLRRCWRRFDDDDMGDVQVSFDNNIETRLNTDLGFLDLDPPLDAHRSFPLGKITPSFSGYGLSPDKGWIVLDGRRLIHIPPEYISTELDVTVGNITPVIDGSTLIWGTLLGRVVRIEFTLEEV